MKMKFADYLPDLPPCLHGIIESYCSEFDLNYWSDNYHNQYPYDATEQQLQTMFKRYTGFFVNWIGRRAAELGSLSLVQKVYTQKGGFGDRIVQCVSSITTAEIWEWIYDQCMQHIPLKAKMRELFHPMYINNVNVYRWFQSMDLIRNDNKVFQHAVKNGRLDIVKAMEREDIDIEWIQEAAQNGHLNIIEWYWDLGRNCQFDYVHAMSLVASQFPPLDEFQRILEKTKTKQLDFYGIELCWDRAGPMKSKLDFLRYLLIRWQYTLTTKDILYLSQSNFTWKTQLQLPKNIFATEFNLHQLHWIERNFDSQDIKTALECNPITEHNWECMQWFISKGLLASPKNRLRILNSTRTYEEFLQYVTPEMVALNWPHYRRLVLYMIRYISTNKLDYEIKEFRYCYWFHMLTEEVAQFIAAHCSIPIPIDLLGGHTSLKTLKIIGHLICVEEYICHYVKDQETFHEFLEIFPNINWSHPSLVKLAHKRRFLLPYLMDKHPELCDTSKREIEKQLWGFTRKRKEKN